MWWQARIACRLAFLNNAAIMDHMLDTLPKVRLRPFLVYAELGATGIKFRAPNGGTASAPVGLDDAIDAPLAGLLSGGCAQGVGRGRPPSEPAIADLKTKVPESNLE
jgi:hypothetical protein